MPSALLLITVSTSQTLPQIPARASHCPVSNASSTPPATTMPASLSFRRPRYGKVWEHGGTVDVVVRCENVNADADDDVVVAECAVSLSAVSNAWMRASRTIAVGTVRFTPEGAGDAGNDASRGKDGLAPTSSVRFLDEGWSTWIVPEDLPSGEYELKASVTNAKPPIEATTRVIVSERVSVTRTSASEATVRWDRGRFRRIIRATTGGNSPWMSCR